MKVSRYDVLLTCVCGLPDAFVRKLLKPRSKPALQYLHVHQPSCCQGLEFWPSAEMEVEDHPAVLQHPNCLSEDCSLTPSHWRGPWLIRGRCALRRAPRPSWPQVFSCRVPAVVLVCKATVHIIKSYSGSQFIYYQVLSNP